MTARKLLFLSVLTIGAWPSHASTLLYNPAAVGVPFAIAGTSAVQLSPFSVTLRPTPTTQFQTAMSSSLAAQDWQGELTFNYDYSLSGTFIVDVYNPRFAPNSTTIGGAEFLLRYQRGAGDPLASNLFWIQAVKTSAPLNGESGPYADVWSQYEFFSENLPFYYRPPSQIEPSGETAIGPNPYTNSSNPAIRSGSYSLNGGPVLGYDMAFWDAPTRSVPLSPNVTTWRGELFLAEWTGGGSINVLDGVEWGFDLMSAELLETPAPVPEPAAALLLAPGLAWLVWRRRRAA